ncbi:MAG TPA: hypothetical protein VLG37_05150 [Candidatus Saccharimonadales bacterium]|nr:hypothetical protein [Candidatus Saccharimonadales bacterium]
MKQFLERSAVEHARDSILAAGLWEVAADFKPYVVFASGKQANNKLDLEAAIDEGQPDDLQAAVLDPMKTLVERYDPDALWGVPSGGQSYASKIGAHLSIPVVRLKKKENSPGVKTYELEDPEEDGKRLRAAKRLVGVEDAGSERTSLYGALYLSHPQLVELTIKTVGVALVWQRGLVIEARHLGVPVTSVIQEHIPNLIRRKHPFFKKYGSLAVMREQAEV